MKKVERWKVEMPTEQEMLPKDKYTVFDRKVKRYRKGIHSKSYSFWGRREREGMVKKMLRCSWMLKVYALYLACVLISVNRGAEVDESEPEAKSPGFLSEGVAWSGVKGIEEEMYNICYIMVCIGRLALLEMVDTNPLPRLLYSRKDISALNNSILT